MELVEYLSWGSIVLSNIKEPIWTNNDNPELVRIYLCFHVIKEGSLFYRVL